MLKKQNSVIDEFFDESFIDGEATLFSSASTNKDLGADSLDCYRLLKERFINVPQLTRDVLAN